MVMTSQAESESRMTNEMPYEHTKIPVSNGLREFEAFIADYPDFTICPYIADKTEDGWDISTSRTYMNQALPSFLYVPVNIPKDDLERLNDFFNAVKDNSRIAAVNITQPHKSSPVVRRIFLGDENTENNVDTLIRNDSGELQPYDLNAPSFVSWYKDEVGEFTGKDVVLVGVGGVGEPMAKAIAKENPNRLVLVDPTDKSYLAEQLQGQFEITYKTTISEVAPNFDSGVVLINAAGKEGVGDSTGIDDFLENQTQNGSVFVDIRPQLAIEVVERAKQLGWQSYTGYGMNARNDYTLLSGIAKYMGVEPEPFTQFQAQVASAS